MKIPTCGQRNAKRASIAKSTKKCDFIKVDRCVRYTQNQTQPDCMYVYVLRALRTSTYVLGFTLKIHYYYY